MHNDAFNALVSLGDRRLGCYLEHVFEKNIPVKNLIKEYRKFMRKHNAKALPEEQLPHYSEYIYKEKMVAELLPWEFIQY